MFMARYAVTAEQQRGIALGIDAQPHAAPFQAVALAGHQVLDLPHRLARARWADPLVAEMQPELVRPARQRDGAGDRVGVVDRLFQEAGDAGIVHRQEAQVRGLQQRRIRAPDGVEPAQVVLDIAGLVPVARLQSGIFPN